MDAPNSELDGGGRRHALTQGATPSSTPRWLKVQPTPEAGGPHRQTLCMPRGNFVDTHFRPEVIRETMAMIAVICGALFTA
jgi:hypothetical protein